MLVALAAYILNIEASGTCQYGPRYLLPAMPLVSLGLVGLGFLRGGTQKLLAGLTALHLLPGFILHQRDWRGPRDDVVRLPSLSRR